MLWNTVAQTVELGWDFYVPVICLWRLSPGRASLGRDWQLRHFDVADVGRSAASALSANGCSAALMPLR